MRQALLVLPLLCSPALADGIKYKSNYKSAKAESVATGKPLVIIFGTDAKGKGC